MNASVEILYQKIIISFVIHIFIFSQEVPHTHILILKLLSFILHLWKSFFFFFFKILLKLHFLFKTVCASTISLSSRIDLNFFHCIHCSCITFTIVPIKNMLQRSFTNLESIWVSDLFEDRYPFLFNFTSDLYNTKKFWVSAQQFYFEWMNVWIAVVRNLQMNI